MALLGIVPLAGLLGHGTETIALYTGDALGGLVNAVRFLSFPARIVMSLLVLNRAWETPPSSSLPSFCLSAAKSVSSRPPFWVVCCRICCWSLEW